MRKRLQLSLKDRILDIAGTILDYAGQAFMFVIRKVSGFISASWQWFLDLPICEKLIVFAGLPAVFAAVLPIATFEIFDSFFQIHNPAAHLVVLLALFMFASIFFRHNVWVFIGRIALNLYYFFKVLYIVLADGAITKADKFSVSDFYFINFTVPVIYIIFSLLSWKSERR